LELPERLDFTLPDFTRLSWASDAARNLWEPRLGRIAAAWAEIEWRSVTAGIRPCALLRTPVSQLATATAGWIAASLWPLPLTVEGGTTAPYSSTPVPLGGTEAENLICLVLGSRPDVLRFRKAWEAGDNATMGALLGYPRCCREFFRRVWVEGGRLDTTWPMATQTRRPEGRCVSLAPEGPPWPNVLCRWLGVRAVPHLPCRFDCVESRTLGERLMAFGREAGFGTEVDWLREVLNWPLEWSALHGIAEIKTPVVRISARTDATAQKYVVHWQGEGYPQEGASGLSFPYRQPARPQLTASAAFRRGLRGPARAAGSPPPWYGRGNGFDSLEAMDAAHAPLVELARAALGGDRQGGRVMDLGCGNGALLQKLCPAGTGLIPHGIDLDHHAIGHAKGLLPAFADHFLVGDLFDTERWAGGGERYLLTLLMVGRLLEAPPPGAGRLLSAIEATSERLLVYAYPGYSEDGLETLARRAELTLAGPPHGYAAWAVLRSS
jgi:hypothetical protein